MEIRVIATVANKIILKKSFFFEKKFTLKRRVSVFERRRGNM